MRVIMLKDVKGVGKKDQIVTVKDGYALNFLFPKGLAVQESKRSVEILSEQQADRARLDAENKAKAQEIALRLENITLEFFANAGEDGRMFGTISTKQVALKLKEEFDIEIDKRKIISKVAVDRLGYTTLEVELYKGVIGKIRVHVSENK